jgi:hypothetical protein
VATKLPPDEIDGDFRSFTLSLSAPPPPLLKPEDNVPVSSLIVRPMSDVADRQRPRYSGALFPKKPKRQA